jgi:hypothetical protein
MICKRNRRIYDQTTSARDALEKLEAAGCKVIDVRLGGRAPVIYIEPDAAAAQLDGAQYMRERIHGRLVGTMVMPLCGCQVRWAAPVERATGTVNGSGMAPLRGVPA